MATAGFRGGVILWDLPAGVQRGYLDGLFGGATAIAFNFGGSLLAIGSDDGTVELYDPTTCKRMATLCGHANSVMALAFSPHGDKALYSGSVDGSVRVWRVGASENHELCALYSFADGSWVVLTPEGRYDSSSDGANLHIRGRIGQRFIPLSDLRKDHYESGLLRKVLKTDQEK